MSEVTRSNYDEMLGEIEYNLRKATIISIDCEFSGLPTVGSDVKNSLFDTSEQRYIKLRSNIGMMIALQVGISTFQYNRDLNQYDSSAYKFYIFPRSFGNELDVKFLCQASSFEFLCRFNFDFNKVMYEGLPYLNRNQQLLLKEKLKDGSFKSYVFSSLEGDEQRYLHEVVNSFSSWIKSISSEKDVYSFSLQFNNDRFIYALSHEITSQFPSAWCFIDNNVGKVRLVSEEERSQLEKENGDPEMKLFLKCCGFSRIFNLLVELKKPIVGHNLLMDLLILYNQFYQPLPDSLESFKENVHKLFPLLYDTKVISFEVRRSLNKTDKIPDTSLSSVYNFVRDRSAYLAPFTPHVELKTDFPGVEAQQIHDAGWDAYITGFSFIRLCHWSACKRNNTSRPFSSPEHLKAMEHLKNKINLARASVTYVDLVNKETGQKTRPPLLFVTCKKKCKIDVNHLTDIFAKYGGFDIKPVNNYSALLAVSSFGSANAILKDFKRNTDLRVEKYSFLRHSQALRFCLWAGVFVPLISLGIVLSLKKSEKAS